LGLEGGWESGDWVEDRPFPSSGIVG
jgi:hypothetical protein